MSTAMRVPMISVIGGASSARRVSLRLLRAYLLLPSANLPSSYASGPRRFHETDAADRLLQHARHLTVHVAATKIPSAQLLEHRLQRESQQRQDDERDERQLPRDAEQDRDVDEHQRCALERLRHDLREDEARLERVVDHAREDLPRLHLGEVAERKVREVAIDGVAQIARHVLLERRAELPSDPHQQILEQHRRHDEQDDVAQRAHLVAGNDLTPHRRVQELRHPPRLERCRRLVEEDVEERDQQRDRKAVEQRREQVACDRDRHPPRVRAQVREKPLADWV